MPRILLTSDIHYCDMRWHGLDTKTIMTRMIDALQAEYNKEPYDLLLMLGDYSLDHWGWRPYGCYINSGVSYTEKFVKEIVPHLPCPSYMIPGNHEQYGNEKWKALTGFERRTAIPYHDSLFILLDNYDADLDPTEHSDGTYTQSDVVYIREQMARNPKARFVFLCAHEFLMDKESTEFKTMIREDERIVALLAGHTHLSQVIPLGEECGNKMLLRTGQFSYSDDIKNSRWGWREIRFEDDGSISSAYITPPSDMMIDGAISHSDGGRQNEAILIDNNEKERRNDF